MTKADTLKVRAAEKAVVATALAYTAQYEDGHQTLHSGSLVPDDETSLFYSWMALRAAARTLREVSKA